MNLAMLRVLVVVAAAKAQTCPTFMNANKACACSQRENGVRRSIDACALDRPSAEHTRAERRCETVRKAGARPGLSKHRKCLLSCAGHNATLVPHTCCSGRHGGDTGPKRNGVRLVGVLCIILACVSVRKSNVTAPGHAIGAGSC